MILILMIATGGLIGYLTNMLAIKLLFRPTRQICLFGHRIPFTPGVIVRRQREIAERAGEIVENDLLKPERVNIILKAKIETYLSKRNVADLGLVSFFKTISNNLLEKAVASVPISNMVREEISEFDVTKIEKVVKRVAGTELMYIELLGGVLGALIGAIQYFTIINLI